MNRTQRVALLVLACVVAGIAWLAMRTRQPPLLPADPDHATFHSSEACLVCHGPGGALPRGPNHPLGDDCLRCHGGAR